ncbi:Rieske 2Fe-2S domain-containing protein [Mariniblastus sp.]|nr:Rieske 2Fe-2S domain-containing protein [Mariniblastus sp.]
MSEYIAVATVAEIDDGSTRLIEVDDRLVILSRIGDDYYCIDDICTHDGGTLSDGPHEVEIGGDCENEFKFKISPRFRCRDAPRSVLFTNGY